MFEVTDETFDHDVLQASGPSLPLAGTYTLASFSAHLAALDLFPDRLRHFGFLGLLPIGGDFFRQLLVDMMQNLGIVCLIPLRDGTYASICQQDRCTIWS